MSTSRKQVHAPVRGDGRRTGEKPAGPDVVAQVGEHDTRLWRLVRHYVDEARPYGDYTGVQAIGIDGTGRKGRNCITVVADQAERNVVRVVPGKDAHTVERFVQDFMDRNGDPNRVGLVTCDMSLEFARGICEHLSNATKVIDKFHIVKHANEAVDRGRRAEGGHNTKYLCLRNETNPPEPQLEIKRSLRRCRPRTARACRMCEPCRTSAPTAPTGSGPKRGPKHCARE